MGFVYISYSHRDSAFVDRLSSDLQAAGISTWVDRAKLMGGQDWASEVQNAIVSASALLVVISSNSASSAWIAAEYKSAMAAKKLVIPLLLEDPKSVPLDLRMIQWVDFRFDYRQAVQKVLTALSQIVPAGPPQEPLQPKAKGYFFISYAEEDSDFVEGMREFLGQRQYGYWDYQESERDYSSQMFVELEQRIEQAAALFSILSPDWKLSKWAPKEYLFATEVGIPTFLLMVRPMGPTLMTVGVPYIDFVADPSKGFSKLDKELKRKRLV